MYTILTQMDWNSSNCTRLLTKQVEYYLANGWALQGGISIIFHPVLGYVGFQSMYGDASSTDKELMEIETKGLIQ